MATYTTYYNFYLPALGDGVLNGKPWGAYINANFSTIDTTLNTFNVNITAAQSAITTLQGQIGAGGVPAYSASNNGQYLGVVGGAPAWATVQALPAYTTANNGQLLGIASGSPAWVTITGVPAFSASNNGQVLGVVAGALAWVSPGGGSATDIYSTTETLTNKVVDGEQVYRKEYIATVSSSNIAITHGVDQTKITDYWGMFYRTSSGYAMTIKLPHASASGYPIGVYILPTQIMSEGLPAYGTGTVRIVLEYTK